LSSTLIRQPYFEHLIEVLKWVAEKLITIIPFSWLLESPSKYLIPMTFEYTFQQQRALGQADKIKQYQ